MRLRGARSEVGPLRLTDFERTRLLEVARWMLEERLVGCRPRERRGAATYVPVTLARRAATFVTLRRADDGELRGCCGEIEARRRLVESVAAMAIASAQRDRRFPPVAADELEAIRIGISVLGPLRTIEPAAVEVGRHGLRITAGGRHGLLLPGVAVDLGWDRERLLRGVCEKAGLEPDAWRSVVERSRARVRLEAFEASSWSESPVSAGVP